MAVVMMWGREVEEVKELDVVKDEETTPKMA